MNFRQFQVLGDEIHRKLRRVSFDELSLPDLAAEALTTADLDTDFQLDEVAGFLLTTGIMQQPRLRFSNLPPVVYRCDDFYIELLVWMDATTVVHQHAFSGAFRVFTGSSVHSVYRFDEHERISSRLLVGDARLDRVEILRRGEVRQIRPGRGGLLHALFHLEQPSVTLVVRNYAEPWAQPQYVLVRPHIALAERDLARDPKVETMKRLLDAAAVLDPEQAADLLIHRGPQLDFPRLFKVVKDRYHLLSSERRWRRFLELAEQAHGHLADHLAQMVRSAKREASIKATRCRITDSDLRFFLALLLNVPSRQWIDRLVQDNYPAAPPHALYRQWLKRLAGFHGLARGPTRRSRFPARLARAMPFGTDDARTDAILQAVVAGVGAEVLGETFHDDKTASAAREAHARLMHMDELEPLLAAGRTGGPG